MIFIKKNMGGTLPEASFNKLAIKASAYIKRHTFGRIDINNIQEEVKLCTCSIVEQMKKLEKGQGKTSESVGAWSVNYQTNSESEKRLYNILLDYLSEIKDKEDIPLLYRGG